MAADDALGNQFRKRYGHRGIGPILPGAIVSVWPQGEHPDEESDQSDYDADGGDAGTGDGGGE